MKFRMLKTIIPIAVLSLMTGCSLLKFSIETGQKPLSTAEANTRLMTRGFYYELTDDISRAADSIADMSTDVNFRINAIKWKMQVSRAAASAAMETVPDIALLNTWLFCRRMDETFGRMSDDKLFGKYTAIARKTAARLDAKVERLAKSLLTENMFSLMSDFIASYLKTHTETGWDIRTENTMLGWVDYLKQKGVTTNYTIGSISEVVADIGDRFGSHAQVMTNSIGWSKDIIELRLQQDSIRDRLAIQFDSLENDFNRIAMVMENIPQISDEVTKQLSGQVNSLIWSMNRSVDNAFDEIDKQRTELQKFVSEERVAIVEQTREAADAAVKNALDSLPSLIGKTLLYIILFVAIMVGGPFALGLWVGKLRERKAHKKHGSE